MKIIIDRDVDIILSYTTLGGGKLVLDVPKSEAKMIVESILEELGATPIASVLSKDDMDDILEAFRFEDIMNYYGVVQVLEWVEANR